MKNVKNYLLILLLVCLSSCKAPHAPPIVEICIHNADNSAECTDLRLPKEKQQYTKSPMTNDICTKASDEAQLYNYCSDLRQKLIECENRQPY